MQSLKTISLNNSQIDLTRSPEVSIVSNTSAQLEKLESSYLVNDLVRCVVTDVDKSHDLCRVSLVTNSKKHDLALVCIDYIFYCMIINCDFSRTSQMQTLPIYRE